jgi:hypothetical protein
LVLVLSAIAIVPSAPVMVPELAGAAAAETAELRQAAVTAVAALPQRWIAVGAAVADEVCAPPSVGTFAGYGVDIRVGLSAEAAAAADAGAPPAVLPLCALITAWLRGVAHPDALAVVRALRGDHPAEAAVAVGRQVRRDAEDADEPVGVLVVADGAHTLTPPAPGGYDPHSISAQAALDDALAAGDTAALTRLPAGIVGRVAYQALAGLTDAPRSAKELYRGAPYGVGYFVGVWTP